MEKQFSLPRAAFSTCGGAKTKFLSVKVLLSLFLLLAFPAAVHAESYESYDFTTGTSSTGPWWPYFPLAPYGDAYTFSDDSAGYRLQCAPSVNPALLGPARVGSFLEGSRFNFMLAFDVPSYSSSLAEFFGAAARMGELGLLTSSGYALGYDNSVHQIGIWKVVNEQFVGVITPPPASASPPKLNAVTSQISTNGSNIGPTLTLYFSGVAGRLYSVESANQLTATNWFPKASWYGPYGVGNPPEPGWMDDHTFMGPRPVTVARESQSEFFRIVMLPLTNSQQTVTLTPGQGYRFAFLGNGCYFAGAVYSLNNLTVPLAFIVGTDCGFSAGLCGLLVQSKTAAGAADATFSRFSIWDWPP